MAKQQAAKPKEAPQRPAPDPELTAAINVVFYGGEEAAERLREFPRAVQEKAIKRARESNELRVLAAADPEAYYHKVLGPIVDRHIRARTHGFEEQASRSRDGQAVDTHRTYLAEGSTLDRVKVIMDKLPTGGSFKERLDLAVELDRGRSGSATLAKREQRQKSKERDAKANSNGKRRRGRGRRRSGGRPKAPERHIDDVMGEVEFLQQLEKEGKL